MFWDIVLALLFVGFGVPLIGLVVTAAIMFVVAVGSAVVDWARLCTKQEDR